MGEGAQKNTEGHEGDKRAGGAADKAPGPRRKGREPKEAEPGINDCDLFRVIDYYFPSLVAWLGGLEDFRKASRVFYPQALLILICVIERICGNSSSRQHDLDKREGAFVANIMRLSRCDTGCLPHSDTLKYYKEKSRRRNLASIPPRMFGQLLRKKRVYGLLSRFAPVRGCPSFLVAVDGVHWHTSASPLEHSTRRTHGDGRVEYMYTALQATVVTPDGIRLPLMTEFIENPEGKYDKQDCELKAAKRLLERLKKGFPKLRMTILMDGLYLCESIIRTCVRNGWGFSITVTDHAAAFRAKAEAAMARSGNRIAGDDPVTGLSRTVSWCNKVEHTFGETKVSLNVVREETRNSRGEDVTLFYATSIFLHGKEDGVLQVLDRVCRARWQIEESFKEQKHHGLELEAVFGTKGNAGHNYYLIVQIAHIIRTFMLHSSLFRRLQQHCSNGRICDPIRRPMLEWYKSIGNLVERLKISLLKSMMSDIDMSGWRLECDTA